ncbi:MAG: hypothetical protein SXG53_18590 [Pseudomonadota bacterium]|nr:hypothetical protein [Pseudomonadota bacterium]
MKNNITAYLKSGAEEFPDSAYGPGYRCSAYLTDGTFLPCVMLRSSAATVQLALRRFEQEKKGLGVFRRKGAYEEIVKTFVTEGNRINSYDIATVEPSRHAIPLALLRQIRGETTMAWTGFVFEMTDGRCFAYGTTFLMEFFDLPAGYAFQDVRKVHNHSYVAPGGEVRSLREGMADQPADYDPTTVLREKPYFVCYHDAWQEDK